MGSHAHGQAGKSVTMMGWPLCTKFQKVLCYGQLKNTASIWARAQQNF